MRVRLTSFLLYAALVATCFSAVGSDPDNCGEGSRCFDPVTPPPPSTQLVGVNTNTGGTDVDPDGYSVTLSPSGTGEARTGLIGTIGQTTFSNVATGTYTLELTGVQANCTVQGGGARTIVVTAGSNDFHNFELTCAPNVGSVHLFNETDGDPGIAGYMASVQGAPGGPELFPPGFNLYSESVPVGDQDVTVSGIPARCFLIEQPTFFGPARTRTVPVEFGQQTSVSYRFDCTLVNGALRVTTQTTGTSADPDGHDVTLDGEAIVFCALGSQAQCGNGDSSYDFAPLPAGDHEVFLSGVAGHCVVSNADLVGAGLWRKIGTVVATDVREVVFGIDCPTSGSILVLTPSAGEPHDFGGYLVTVGNDTRPIFGSGQRFDGLAPGTVVDVRLDDIQANCTVAEPNPQQVTVVANEEIVVTFTVTCAPHPTPIDPVGVWNFHVEITEAGGVCNDLEVYDTPITIAKSGSAPVWNVTARGFADGQNNVLMGTFDENANRLVISGNYPDDGGTTTATHDLIAGTADEMLGRESWDWSDGAGGTCPNGGSNVTATRVP